MPLPLSSAGKHITSTLQCFAPISASKLVGNIGATLLTFSSRKDVCSLPPPEDGPEIAGAAGLEGGLAMGSGRAQCGREGRPTSRVVDGGNNRQVDRASCSAGAWYEDEMPEFVRDPFQEGLEREMGALVCERATRAATL